MRWVKHLSHAHLDEAMDVLSEKHGAEGYGVYWYIVEHIAMAMEPGHQVPSATHTEVKWAQICHVSVRTLRNILQTMSIHLAVVVPIEDESSTIRVKIEVPKILKYKDEYSKKSGETPYSRAEREQRESREEKKHPLPPLAADAAECAKNPEPKTYDPLAALIEGTANVIHERHPNDEGRRDIGPAGVRKHLRAIANLQPPAERIGCIEAVNRRHAAWCEYWKGHGYTKGLNNWLAPTMNRWASDPPANGNGQMSLTTAMQAQGTETYRERDRRLAHEIMVKQITKGMEFYGKSKV